MVLGIWACPRDERQQRAAAGQQLGDPAAVRHPRACRGSSPRTMCTGGPGSSVRSIRFRGAAAQREIVAQATPSPEDAELVTRLCAKHPLKVRPRALTSTFLVTKAEGSDMIQCAALYSTFLVSKAEGSDLEDPRAE